jgi:hypothetical protein
MAPGPVPYIDGEGGKPNYPPYGEDFFQRIVGVHWREGVLDLGFFVAGNESGDAAFNKTIDTVNPTDKTTPINVTWYEIGGLPFSNPPREIGAIYASAFGLAKKSPVFLLGGYKFHEEDFGFWQEGIIMASRDGINWTKVYSFVGISYKRIVFTGDGENVVAAGQFSAAYIHSLVWDGRQFWAGGYVVEHMIYSPVFHYTKSDVLFSSIDGFSWSEVGRNKLEWTSDDTEPDLPKAGLIVNHCNRNFIDSNGNGVPNGAWGENKAAGIMIGPVNPPTVDYKGNDDRSNSYVMPVDTGSVVRIIGPNGVTTANTGIGGVMGVAFAGGAWWAVGSTMPGDLTMAGSAIGAYSVDDGQTWVPADIGLGANATTVSGG